jgi:hypothetical protein
MASKRHSVARWLGDFLNGGKDTGDKLIADISGTGNETAETILVCLVIDIRQ